MQVQQGHHRGGLGLQCRRSIYLVREVRPLQVTRRG